MKMLYSHGWPWWRFGLCALSFLVSCEHSTGPAPASIKKWEAVEIKAAYEIPAPTNRSDEGELTLELFSDNSLHYEFHLTNFAASDALTDAHIHTGDAGSNGPVFIPLNPVFTGAAATGVVNNLRPGQVDTLLNNPVYFNVHSTQLPGGVARAQLDKSLSFAADLNLSGNNEVPTPVSTTATGTCILRLAEDETLYSKISISNLEADDTLTAAHIHLGAAGTNGPVRIFLAASEADFGVLKVAQLPDSLYQMLKADPVYVNAHSKRHPAGIIRAQIR